MKNLSWHLYSDEHPKEYGWYIVYCKDGRRLICRWDSDIFELFDVIFWSEYDEDYATDCISLEEALLEDFEIYCKKK